MRKTWTVVGVVWAVVAVGLLAGLGWAMLRKPAEPTAAGRDVAAVKAGPPKAEAKADEIEVDAKTLWDDFTRDSVAANAKYTNRLIVLMIRVDKVIPSGSEVMVVQAISKGEDYPRVTVPISRAMSAGLKAGDLKAYEVEIGVYTPKHSILMQPPRKRS